MSELLGINAKPCVIFIENNGRNATVLVCDTEEEQKVVATNAVLQNIHIIKQVWTDETNLKLAVGSDVTSILAVGKNDWPKWYQPDMGADTGEPLPDEPTKNLRDEFAMAALTGLACIDCEWKEKAMAKFAYELADDMLEVR